MTNEEIIMIRNMANAGMRDKDIAEKMNYSRQHIGDVRRNQGIGRIKGRPRDITDGQIEMIHELRDRGMSYRQIGTEMQISKDVVRNYLR